jgi:hypothetical protein
VSPKGSGGITISLTTASLAAVVLASCSTGGADKSAMSAAPRSTAATPADSPGPPPVRSAAANATTAVRACSPSDLQVSLGAVSGTASADYQYINFQNTSAAACTLSGFPGISLRSSISHRQVGAAATWAPGSDPAPVAVQPGGLASALMRVALVRDYPDSVCHPAAAATLQVYPPGQTVPLEVPYAVTGCEASVDLLRVTAIEPGAGFPSGAYS